VLLAGAASFDTMAAPTSVRKVIYAMLGLLLGAWLPWVGSYAPWLAVLLIVTRHNLDHFAIAQMLRILFLKDILVIQLCFVEFSCRVDLVIR
jgi:hypothetical protein